MRDISKLKSDRGSIEKQMCDVMDQLGDVVTKSDLAYSEVYGQAKKTIYVVNKYIGLRTLVLLKNAPVGVAITLFSDNVGNRLHSIEYKDFCSEYPTINVTLKKTGARVTSIVEDFGIGKYKALIDGLLKNPKLTFT